jgi:type I restriction-modification system DNA methylase subunit
MADVTAKSGTQTWQELAEIGRFGYAMSDVFRDFIDICLNTLLSYTDNLERSAFEELTEKLQQNALDGEYVECYMQIVAKYPENQTRPYGKRPGDFFASAFDALQRETHASQQDVLGFLYERHLSLGEHGQFVTPPDVSKIVTMLPAQSEGDTVYESAVGSGRLLIAAAQHNPRRHFVGIDVSPICAHMAALNMWLFNLDADIYQGNILSKEMKYLWRIRRGGFIWESRCNTVQPSTNA